MTWVEVELHSQEPSAVDATMRTICALPGGDFKKEDGRFYVPSGFVAWACEQQGYVKAVKK